MTLLTPVEAADRLRVGRTMVYQLMRSGHLESVHIGRRRFVPEAAVEEFVERLREGTRVVRPRRKSLPEAE